MILLKVLVSLLVTATSLGAQPTPETHHYAIEVAGIRVGTMTAVRQPQPNNRTTYTLISDVKVHLLVYTVTIYYKTINVFEGKKLLLSTVETHTNRGDFISRTEWKDDHYEISADQYKYQHKAVERSPIDFPVSSLYFHEPTGRTRVYSEYFGDYFTIDQTKAGSYQARIADREDDYVYVQGRLVKVVKHNNIKNFVMRLLD